MGTKPNDIVFNVQEKKIYSKRKDQFLNYIVQ